MSELSSNLNEIRNIINSARLRNLLIRDRYDWNKLCSSMDIIGDTDMAIKEYQNLQSTDSIGLNYLYIFGILQVLYVQHDAVKHMCESLEIKFEDDEDLRKIREIRNNSIAHPTLRGGGDKTSFHFLIRHSIQTFRFSLLSNFSLGDVPSTFNHYHIPDLINTHQLILTAQLNKVIVILKEEIMAHKTQFSEQKLADIFPVTISYHFEKVHEIVSGSSYYSLSKTNFDLICKTIDDFIAELKRRDIHQAYVGINDILDKLNYPLQKIKDYFNLKLTMEIPELEIYLYYLEEHIKLLQNLAKELDDEYGS